MPGEFVRIGDTDLLLPGPSKYQIDCSLFEWRSTTPEKHGPFKIRFVSWDDERGPLRYWVEPILNHLMTREETSFLEQACKYGYKIVAAIDEHGPETREFYRLAQRIFRNRNVGHMKVARKFSNAMDFVDFSRPDKPELITPGIDMVGDFGLRSTSSTKETAITLLKQAYEDIGENIGDESLKEEPATFRGVESVYRRMAELSKGLAGRADKTSDLMEVEETDSLFMFRVLSDPVDYQGVEEKVRSALIAGPVTQEDFRQVWENDERYFLFLLKLIKKSSEKGMTDSQFDTWLQRVRQDRYLQLVPGGSKLVGEERGQACFRASQWYCHLLWWAYRMMAHCYGVLMYIVFLDFCSHNERPPTELEQWFFRMRHHQLDYLGGLPLAFLEFAQWRWVCAKLDQLESGMQKLQKAQPVDFDDVKEKLGPANYLVISQMLGIYGNLVRERREADRKTKDYQDVVEERSEADGKILEGDPKKDEKQARRNYGLYETTDTDPEPADEHNHPVEVVRKLDDESVLPQMELTSRQCPNCGSPDLQLERSLGEPDDPHPIIDCYCSQCDQTVRVHVDLTEYLTQQGVLPCDTNEPTNI